MEKIVTMKLGHTIEDSKAKCSKLTEEMIEKLRVWSCEELDISCIPDEQLAIFAHSCKYDIEATKRCMEVYYRLRATVPEFFANRDPRSDYLQQSLKALEFCTFPLPDDNGNKIIFHRISDYRPTSYMFNDGIKLLGMTLEASLYYDGCTPGYVFLFDMAGVKLGHLTRLSIGSLRKFFEYLQDGLPVRLKAIHVLNTVWFMNRILGLVKPFMKRELYDMLHLYSGDVSEIYDHIPQKCLPKDFGGEQDSVASLHEAHCIKLDELRDYFIEEERIYSGWWQKNSNRKSSKSSRNESTSDETKDDIKENETIDVDT